MIMKTELTESLRSEHSGSNIVAATKDELIRRVTEYIDETATKRLNTKERGVYINNGQNRVVRIDLADKFNPFEQKVVVYFEDARIETISGTAVSKIELNFLPLQDIAIVESLVDRMTRNDEKRGYSGKVGAVFSDGVFLEPVYHNGKYRWMVSEFSMDSGVWVDGRDADSVKVSSRRIENLLTLEVEGGGDGEDE